MNRKTFFKLLRPAVAAGLLFFLLYRIGAEPLKLVLESRRPLCFALLILLTLIDAVLRATNWGMLLNTKEYNLSLREMLFNYMAGAFFGTFIPSSLGTDVSRAVLVSRRNEIKARDSAIAMVALNLMGLLALSIIGLISGFLLLKFSDNSRLPMLVIAICVTYLTLFPLLKHGKIPFAEKMIRFKRLAVFIHKLQEFSAALALFKKHIAIMTRVLIISLLNQIIAIAMVFTAAMALETEISLLFCVAVVPVIAVSRLIPISIAGLGGEQGVFVLLFTQAGISEAEAFMISLSISFANLTLALIGGCVYMIDSLKNVAGKKNNRRSFINPL